jgi:hypothetical protein
MQKELSNDSNFARYHLQVQDVLLVHEAGNNYEGVAKVVDNGTRHDVTIRVVSDGSNMMWHTENGAFSWLARDEFRAQMRKLFQKGGNSGS